MADSNALVKRVDLAPGLAGSDRVQLMLHARGFRSVAAWARSAAKRRQNPRITEKATWHVLGGRRLTSPASEAILDALAEDTGKPRKVIEALLANRDTGEDAGDPLQAVHAGDDTPATAAG